MFLSGHFHDNYQTQPVRGEVVVFQNFVFGVVLRTLCTFAQVFFELFKVLEVWNCSTVWKFEKNTFGITKQCFLELKSFWVQVNVGELSFITIKKSFRSHKSQSLPISRHFEVISLGQCPKGGALKRGRAQKGARCTKGGIRPFLS